MDGRNVISLSIKGCYQEIYNKIRDMQPKSKTWSTFVFDIISEWYEMKTSGITNFFQSPALWNEQIEKMNDEEYKRFYDQLGVIQHLERVNTTKRLI